MADEEKENPPCNCPSIKTSKGKRRQQRRRRRRPLQDITWMFTNLDEEVSEGREDEEVSEGREDNSRSEAIDSEPFGTPTCRSGKRKRDEDEERKDGDDENANGKKRIATLRKMR